MKLLTIKDFTKHFNSQVFEDYYMLTDIVSHDGFCHDGIIYKLGFHAFVGVFEGKMEITVNQEECVVENSIFICYQGAIITHCRLAPQSRVMCMGFSPEFFFPDKNMYAINHVWNKVGKEAILKLTEERERLTLTLTEMLKAVFIVFENKELMKEAIHGYIEVILSAAGQWYIEDTPGRITDTSSADDVLMSRFISDYLAFSSKERNVSFYASRANLSPKYFSQLVHKASGNYPSDMIRNQVIIEAKGLLSTQLYTVQQISGKLNFTNSSDFAKYFKAATGVSPKEYMKKGEAIASPSISKKKEL